MGDKQDAKFFSHYYMHGDDNLDSSLASHGFHRSDITDVFLTHLHFDHCGGCVVRDGDQLVSAFANAVFWSNQQHWDWAVNPNPREKASFLKENILPMESMLKMIDTSAALDAYTADNTGLVSGGLPELPFLPGFSFRLAGGHTRAMMLPQLSVNGRTVVYMADLLPSAAHIPLPYVMAYDMFPMLTLAEKKVFLEEAADQQYILYFEHDKAKECCTVQRTDKGILVSRTGTLVDFGISAM